GGVTNTKSSRCVKNIKRNMLSLAMGMCIAGAAWAADPGGLRISITGADGQPVAGATVRVSSPDSLVSKSGVTGDDATVRLQGLDPATNDTVAISAAGYDDYTGSNVAVVSRLNLSLGHSLGGGGR